MEKFDEGTLFNKNFNLRLELFQIKHKTVSQGYEYGGGMRVMFLHSNQISVDRESVCMGDDVNAPNEKILNLDEGDVLSDVLGKVAVYLPLMSDVIWAVDSGRKVLG